MEHLCHGRASDVCALLRQSAIGKITASVLRICHVHIGDDIHDSAVGLLRQTFVLAAVACFHVEDGDVQTLCANHAQAGVGVAKYEHAIGLEGCKELVRSVDDVAASCAKVIAHCIHIDLRFCELEVTEEDAVEVVVVVLAGMGQDNIEVLAALVDDCGKADDLRACTHDNAKFQFAILLPMNIAKIKFRLFFHNVLLFV